MQPSHRLGLGGVQVCEDGSVVVPGDALVGEVKLIGEAEDVPSGTERLSEHPAGSSGHLAPTSEHGQKRPDRTPAIP